MSFNNLAMRIILSLVVLMMSFQTHAQALDTTHYRIKNVIYKTTPQAELSMDIYYPEDKSDHKLPAVVFFFGGGWVGGSRTHFAPQSKYLASRGIIAITPDYRIRNVHATTPQEAVMDARSAMRYVKMHADELGIDTSRLAAGGGSAGGHLALSTATLEDFDDPQDNTSISPMPDALLLFNPVVNTTSAGFGAKAVGKDTLNLSPYHRMQNNMPPTQIFHGKDDTTVPISNIYSLSAKFDALLVPLQIFQYEAASHGFFNLNREEGKYFMDTLYKTDLFLQSLGYLKGAASFRPDPLFQ
ncbi:acetyl esterase [Catalinimonas alkaloidigena]|uniref:alpha/beta hydrolase n=1 Tax=Catalinimonas alkaloidigena TaxID=1075417 RepID=UPI0024072AE2|nr:alpha/beta hydrolase [Catalinimonas alkaloidigena]MDF9797593.1 acetyl esterase [Catalinimonas alkaloidigena]